MTKESILRLFIAVAVPDKIKNLALTGLDLPESVKKNLRLVAPPNMHLTLAFIGDVPETSVPGLSRAMDEALTPRPSISLCIDQYGAFPSPKAPRVIWAGPSSEPLDLLRLHRDLCTELRKREFAFDNKPFHPHLTLGRAKFPGKTGDLTAYLLDRRLPSPQPFIIEEVHLYQSDLRPKGPVYTVLKTTRFAT